MKKAALRDACAALQSSAALDEGGRGASLFLIAGIQRLDVLCEEELHRVAIGVGLEQTGMQAATAVECRHQGDPRRHLLHGKAVVDAFLMPAPATIIT